MALRFFVASLFVFAGCHAAGYGGSSGGSSGYGGGMKMSMGGGYGGGMKGGMGSGGYGGSGMKMGSGYGGSGMGMSGYGGEPVQAAIQSHHSVQYKDVPSTGMVKPTTIEVGANSIPISILFRSASSNLNIQSKHEGAMGSTQESQSEDEPHILKHQVTKPIMQEVREVITPYRKITQEIKPVMEEIETIVSRAQKKESGYGMGGGMGAMGGYDGSAMKMSSGMKSGGYGGMAKSMGATKGGY